MYTLTLNNLKPKQLDDVNKTILDNIDKALLAFNAKDYVLASSLFSVADDDLIIIPKDSLATKLTNMGSSSTKIQWKIFIKIVSAIVNKKLNYKAMYNRNLKELQSLVKLVPESYPLYESLLANPLLLT